MSKQTITFLDQGTIPDNIDWAAPNFEHEWQRHDFTQPDQVAKRLQGTRIAIVNKVVIDRDVIKACPELELVHVAATGYDNVDLDACKEYGVRVSNVKGYARHAVPEWVVAHLLSLAQNHTRYRQAQEAGSWTEADLFTLRVAPVREVRKLRLGILGKGDIGKGVARRLEPFGTDIVFLERPGVTPARAGYLPFDTALPGLDALLLTCPLTPDNVEFVNKALMYRMKKGALLINPSRGGLINESDLVDVITSGHLGGVAIDVVSKEPIANDNPLMALRHLDNFIMTPHIAWSSQEAVAELMRLTVETLNRFNAGETDHCLV